MRQRVGFARALVVEPDALLMDEPFSALDVLTAENLRTELLNLWGGPDFPTKAMLIVTHNIEEAVQMADRIFVLTSNPGRLRAEIVDDLLPRPRNRRSPEFESVVDHIYGIMTGPGRGGGGPQRTAGRAPAWRRPPSCRSPTPGRRAGRSTGDPRQPRWPRRPAGAGQGAHLRGRRPAAADRRGRSARLRRGADADLHVTAHRQGVGGGRHPHLQGALRRARPTTGRRWCGPSCGPSDRPTTARSTSGSSSTCWSGASARTKRGPSSTTAIDWGRYGELFDFDANTGELELAV